MQSTLPPLAVSQSPIGKRFLAALGYLVELLMLGGATLLLMALALVVQSCNLLTVDVVRSSLQHLADSTLLIVALFSYPHFIWSYRFAYGQGGAFIRQHSWELIGLPVLLLALLALCIVLWTIPVSALPLVMPLENWLRRYGIDPQWSQYKSSGHLLFAWMFLVQFIMGGYHFAMQSFGVALTCAQEKGYLFSRDEKLCLRNSLYALWAVNLLSGYSFLSIINSRCLGFRQVHFPQQWQWAALAVLAFTLVTLCTKVIFPHYRADGKLPPLSSAVTFASIFVWLQPFFQPMAFSAWLAPVAHGMQYIYFSGRVEAHNFDALAARLSRSSAIWRWLYLAVVAAFIYGLGFLFFRYLPLQIDRHHFFADIAPNFFFVGMYIVFSTHHYIIDTVLWRAGSRVKELSYCPS